MTEGSVRKNRHPQKPPSHTESRSAPAETGQNRTIGVRFLGWCLLACLSGARHDIANPDYTLRLPVLSRADKLVFRDVGDRVGLDITVRPFD